MKRSDDLNLFYQLLFLALIIIGMVGLLFGLLLLFV